MIGDSNINIVDNVWQSESLSEEDAILKKIKAQLLVAIREHVIKKGWSATEASVELDLTPQLTMSLISGQISAFSLDVLYQMVESINITMPVDHEVVLDLLQRAR